MGAEWPCQLGGSTVFFVFLFMTAFLLLRRSPSEREREIFGGLVLGLVLPLILSEVLARFRQSTIPAFPSASRPLKYVVFKFRKLTHGTGHRYTCKCNINSNIYKC